jgi:hypothetical protein
MIADRCVAIRTLKEVHGAANNVPTVPPRLACKQLREPPTYYEQLS